MPKLTYKNSGVNYDLIDPFKREAQKTAAKTAKNINRFSFKELSSSRGESAFLIETPASYLAHVEEGLGTKNRVTDIMYKLTKKSYYQNIAQDTVAAIVNDMITLGALPISIAMHLAVGDSNWFKNKKRYQDLIIGWKKACDLSRAIWAGGETPTLKNIIYPETAVLSGSSLGIIKPKNKLIKTNIQSGDQIVLIKSSGIHTNGLTLASKIAENLKQGFLTKLEDDRTFGEALLDPTIIYVPLIEDCQTANIDIHYAVHITGHGWRKLMRAKENFTYIVEQIPEPQPVFKFMQKHGPISDQEAYGNFNMGAGFALYVNKKDVEKIIKIATKLKMSAFLAGHIEKGDKKVIIKPKNLVYEGKTLGVR